MKKRLLAFLLSPLMMLTGCGATGKPSPSPGHPHRISGMSTPKSLPPAPPPHPTPSAPSAFQPFSIAFWNAQHGLLVGQGEIQTTADGGRTWQVRYRDPSLASLDTLPNISATVTGSTYGWVDTGSTLLFTADGGLTWNAIRPNLPVSAPTFVTPDLGWAVPGPTSPTFSTPLMHTQNGGRTWQRLPNPCESPLPWLRAVSFPTAEEGWAVCTNQMAMGEEGKQILATQNGGASWQSLVRIPFPPPTVFHSHGLSLTGYPAGLLFLPDGHGWLWQDRGSLFTTLNSGSTWQIPGVAQPDSIEARSVWFLSDTVGFVLLWDGAYQLVATEDGGRTWTTVHRWP